MSGVKPDLRQSHSALATPKSRATGQRQATRRLPTPADRVHSSHHTMRSALLCLSLTACLAGTHPCLAADFEADAKVWSEQHASNLEDAAKLSAEGYPTDGNQILLTLAEEDGGPVAAFVIANALYGSDPASSYRLHLRAQSALPDEPAVALGVALEQHRRGEYAAASANYRRVLATGKLAHFSALLADCLVRTGQLKAAVTAWNRADPVRHHTEVDYAICAVYGPLLPTQRRGDLIAQIEKGDLTKLASLILLDLAFDTDWWNAKIYEDGLNRDLKRAAELLGRKDARYVALALYAKLTQATEKKASDIQKALQDAKLVIGTGAELPADSQVARALCELAVTAKLITPAELWAAYETPLRARVESQDRDALHLLCWLAAANRNPVLTDLDRQGWEEWNDPAFASSYLVDLFREKKVTSPRDSQLLAAMAIAPDNATLCNLRIALAGDDVTNALIVDAIKAEYRKLSFGETQRDSSRLNNLFDVLGKRL